jgi:WD40 repeat protein
VRIIVNGQGVGAEGLAFSPDGKTIATAEIVFDMQKTTTFVKLSATDTGNEIRVIDVIGVNSVAYSPDGKMLALGSANMISLREADTGKEIRQIDAKSFIVGLAFAVDSKTVAAKTRDSVIRLYEANTGKSIHDLGESTVALGVNQLIVGFGMPEARDFAFSHDGKTIAVGGSQTLRFFTVATGKEQAALGGRRSAVSALVIFPDGKTMISRGADNVIRGWNTADGKEISQFQEPSGSTGVTFSRDGILAAFGKTDGSVRLIDVASGKELHPFRGHASGVAAVAFSPDGKILASRGYNDDKIYLYDTAKGGEIRELTIPGAAPAGGGGFVIRGGYGAGGLGLAFSPDGQTLAANLNANNFMIRGAGGAPQPAGEGHTIRIWDVTTGKEIRKLTLPAQRTITNLVYSPDGRLLATENSDQTLSLWEIASGKERALLGTPAAAAQLGQMAVLGGGGFRVIGRAMSNPTTASLAFSPDGSLMATRGQDNTIRVWEVSYAKEVGSFKGHEGAVNAVAFAPDGKTLASASADTTLLVWDLARLKREPKANIVELQAKEIESLWADLLGDDAAKAARNIQTLAAGSKQATALMRDKLKPATPPDVKMIDQWIADLDSSNFGKRTKASVELGKMGELAVPALKRILDAKPSPETRRRVEPLLEKLTSGILSAEQIRLVRAIETLENMANVEARQVLEALAAGAPGALSTRHAQAALSRLGKT